MMILSKGVHDWQGWSGYLFDHGATPGPHRAVAHRLGQEAVDEVVALHRLVASRSLPGALRLDDHSFFHGVLAAGGRLLGVSVDGVLAAYGVLSFAAEGRSEYGRGIGLPEAAWPGIACLDGVAVHPQWRGNGLHHLLGSWRIAAAFADGRRHVCATVAPSNHISWQTLLALGMRVRGIGRFYGGLMRYILHIDGQWKAPPAPDVGASLCVPVEDSERVASLLADGWVGWRRWMVGERAFLVLGRE